MKHLVFQKDGPYSRRWLLTDEMETFIYWTKDIPLASRFSKEVADSLAKKYRAKAVSVEKLERSYEKSREMWLLSFYSHAVKREIADHLHQKDPELSHQLQDSLDPKFLRSQFRKKIPAKEVAQKILQSHEERNSPTAGKKSLSRDNQS